MRTRTKKGFVALRSLDVGDLLRAPVRGLPLEDAITRFQLGCLARLPRDGDFEPSSEEDDTDSDMSLDDIEDIEVHQQATSECTNIAEARIDMEESRADMKAGMGVDMEASQALQEFDAALQEINADQALDAAKVIAELAIQREPNARNALGYAMLVCMFHDFEDVLRACSSEPVEILRDYADYDEERTAPEVSAYVYHELISGAVSDDLDRGGCTMHVTAARLQKNGVPLTDVLPTILERDGIYLVQFMRLAEEGLMDDMMTERFVGCDTLKQKCVPKVHVTI
jgi:hypothetical protein